MIANRVDTAPADGAPAATRHDLQLGRRLFHLINGVTTATAYALLFTHEQVIHIFGTIACIIYIIDRIRITYPDTVARRTPWVNRFFVRAEEEVRESAMTPFAIAVLLTILTVPKRAALVGIYTLAIADPLAAVVGIQLGRRHLGPTRTVEGSLAFFVVTLVIAACVLAWGSTSSLRALAGAAGTIALAAAVCEVVPLRIDDNLTIPLFVSFISWVAAAAFGVSLA